MRQTETAWRMVNRMREWGDALRQAGIIGVIVLNASVLQDSL
jgi:hypothetical protein